MKDINDLRIGQRVKPVSKTPNSVTRQNEIGTYVGVYQHAPNAGSIKFDNGQELAYWAENIVPAIPNGRNKL